MFTLLDAPSGRQLVRIENTGDTLPLKDLIEEVRLLLLALDKRRK